MTDLSFRVEPEIIIGTDVLNRIGTICKAYGNRVLIITEKRLVKRHLVDRLIALLEDVDVETILFDAIDDRATADVANTAAELAQGARASVIIAFGGFTTQTIARLTAIIAHSSLELFELLDGKDPNTSKTDAIAHDDLLPYIAIPSEADPFIFSRAFLTVDPRDRSVKLVKTPKGLCVAFLLDGALTADIATHQLSVIDALCITFEAYCSKSANFISDTLLEQAMVHYARLLAAHNPYEMDNDAPKDPNDSVNDDANNSLFLMSLGVALSAPGIGAALAYAIHARFPVDKAQCSTILLPLVIERLISVRPEKIAKVAALLGEPTEGLSVADSAHALLSAMKTRIAERTESTKLKDCKLVLDRLVPVAESARNLEFIAYSPWTITSESVFELLKAVF